MKLFEPRTTERIRRMRKVTRILLLAGAGLVMAPLLASDESGQALVPDREGRDRAETPGVGPVSMPLDGTDNPTFVPDTSRTNAVETVDSLDTSDEMQLHGTDNAVSFPDSAQTTTVDAVDYMRLYGTDNPTFTDGSTLTGNHVRSSRTDNPTVTSETSPPTSIALPVTTAPTTPNVDGGEYMRLYGTDNPSFTDGGSLTGEYTRLSGTDDPTFEDE